MASLRRSRDVAPNAIVGAARRIHINRRDEVETFRERSTEEWQQIAWRHYDEIGDIKYAFNYFAAIASRVRLYVGYQDEASDTPSPIGDVKALDRSFVTAARYELAKLNNGAGGQPNLIRQAVLNLLVAGELYLVGANNTWAARSTSELRFESTKRIRLVSSRENARTTGIYLPESAFVARIWRTHPQYSDDADSSLKGIQSDCNELLLLSRLIRASAQSRLNAGILYVADELRFSRSSDPTAEPNPDLDPFEEELTLALTDPIGQTDSPSEIVPMIVRGPAEFIENGLKHIDLSRGFDETVILRHDQMLTRILNGLDIPRDLVTGLANVRYSNAQTIGEDMLKAHVEPMVLILCEALTTVFLRTQMTARGYSADLIKRLHVWYDPSEVVTRPDRSEDADKGFERMLVKAATWRRAHGFTEDDAPDDEEIAMRVALSGGVAQSTTLDFLRQLAPELVEQAEQLARASFGDPARVTPESGFITEEERTPLGGTRTPPVALPPAEGSPAPYTEIAASAVTPSQIIDILHSITATARPSSIVRDRTRRLERSLEVERRLRESLHVHLNDVVRRALERAGARTVSKVRGDANLKSLVSSVSLEEAFSVIPEDQRTLFALNDVQLIGDTIERARSSYFDLITTAQDQGWRALGAHVHDQMKPRQRSYLERSWDWVSRQLTSLTRTWLRQPKTEGSYVPLDIVRDATALAGGGRILTRDAPHTGPTGSGKAILGPTALDATGWEFSERYRWVYGVSENSYEPHVRLDDQIFGNWEDRVLATADPAKWPYVTHHYPGDHNGCRCDWLPEVLDPKQVNAPTRGQTWEEPIAASAPNGRDLVLSTRNGQHSAVETRT